MDDAAAHAAHAAYAADFLANGPPPGAPRLVRQMARVAGGGFPPPGPPLPMAGGALGGGGPPPLHRQRGVGE